MTGQSLDPKYVPTLIDTVIGPNSNG